MRGSQRTPFYQKNRPVFYIKRWTFLCKQILRKNLYLLIFEYVCPKNFRYMKKISFLSTLLLSMFIVVLVGCSHRAETSGKTEFSKTDIYKNTPRAAYIDSICVPYKMVGDSALRLDIYSLKEDTTTHRPVLVHIHGGSWMHGDKSGIWRHYRQAVLEGFVQSHYVVISIDYRLVGKDAEDILTELEDCRDALSWIKRHASEYRYDAECIGLWGTSAGAHLSLLLGCETTDSISIRYVIDDYGPTDIDQLIRTDLSSIAIFIGRIFKPDLMHKRDMMMQVFNGKETELSPINCLHENMPPVMIFHGTEDSTVPIDQAYNLAERLQQNGIAHSLIVYPGEKHVLSTLSNQEVETHVHRAVSFADSCNFLRK